MDDYYHECLGRIWPMKEIYLSVSYTNGKPAKKLMIICPNLSGEWLLRSYASD